MREMRTCSETRSMTETYKVIAKGSRKESRCHRKNGEETNNRAEDRKRA